MSDIPPDPAAGGSVPSMVWVISGIMATVILMAIGIGMLISDAQSSSVKGQVAPTTAGQPGATVTTPSVAATAVTPTSPALGRPTMMPSAGRGDSLEGELPDQVIQQILDEAELTNVPSAVETSARAAGWQILAKDLVAGGWRSPRLQAAAVTAPGTDLASPPVVDMTAIWAAISPPGEPVDAQRSIVRLIREGSTWTLVRIS